MDVYYDGAHSITFGDKHSWNDWHLVPKSMPIISPPPIHTNTVEVPGANGYVDLTDFPTGYPTYGNRTGTLDFYVDHTAEYWDWDNCYDAIINYLHGQKMKMILDDDHSFYYEGRFALNSFKSEKMACTVSIDYDLFPYKFMRWSTGEADQWPWDPFDFQHGVIVAGSDFVFESNSTSTWTELTEWDNVRLGVMPITPTFKVNAENGGLDFMFANWNLDTSKSIDPHGVYHTAFLQNGVHSYPTIQFATPKSGDKTSFKFKGVGSVTIDFRQGRL